MTDSPQFTLGGMFDAKPNRRLFLGLWPDEAAVADLVDRMQRLQRDGVIPHRAVDPDRLHVTLFHIDDFVDQIPSGLVPAVSAAADSLRCAPFTVRFDRVLCTPKHVLLFPAEGLAALQAFRAELGRALIAAGLPRLISTKGRRGLDRPFNPHVTLSYNPSTAPEMRVDPVGWTVRGFHLVESLLGQHRHVRLGSWPLEG